MHNLWVIASKAGFVPVERLKIIPSMQVPLPFGASSNPILAKAASSFVAGALLCGLTSCNSKEEADQAAASGPQPGDFLTQQPVVHGPEIKNVELTQPLNQTWIDGGKTIYDVKCMPCHRLTADKLVGPGWLGVTKRRTPVWIMNMVCNTDKMLAEDAEAQKLLEMCLVRMPNQNVSVEDARKILEFMRKNDGAS